MIDLLLMADIEHLGKRGAKVSVRPGYARNYLLPQGLAVFASDDNVRMVEKRRVRWLAEEAKLIEELKELARHIAALDLKIVAKASEQGHLFGSVTERDIAQAASQKGLALDVRWVKLAHHLKEVGDYDVPVRLHEQVNVTIPVRVRAEGREDWVPGAEVEPAAETASAPDESATS